MRAVIQRVQWAEVEVEGRLVGQIKRGLLVYVGVAPQDTPVEAARLADKVATLRIFEDEQEKMNLSVQDIAGGVLAIPNFTLLADARKGRRPAFDGAAPPDLARGLFDAFRTALARSSKGQVAAGIFGAGMVIRSAADGPVNIVLDILLGGLAQPQQEGARTE
jgi:D-tyrosyl-tRNA(Tyr) deacylase